MADERTTSSSQTNQSVSIHLYLHSSEKPTTLLASPLLDSSNYHSWSRSVLTTLNAKNKVEFILGTNPCPKKDHSNYST